MGAGELIEMYDIYIIYPCPEFIKASFRFIFDPKNEMFLPLEEGGPGLQPNPFPPPHIKQKHYRLAGK